jgi:amidohydrolase
MPDYTLEAQSLFEYTQFLRRDFHRHPEIGFQEIRTAGIVARELNALGLEVTTGIGKTGVVALLEGARPGPVVLVRFDMDALPITEETGAEYASENPGTMHACGHDGHTAIGLTVARMLLAHRTELAGSVKFVFQPAEEGLGGAEGMIVDGVLENPPPTACLALHLWNEQPVGWLGISPGPVMAASEIFKIRITGKGGHAAVPHQSKDAVLTAAHVIIALQSIISRNIAPLQSAVISVTMVHGGEAFNVIPAIVELQGTIRTFEPQVRQRVRERFNQIVSGVAASFECQAEIEVNSVTPAVINDPAITAHVRRVAEALLPGSTIPAMCNTMGSEDMAFMMQSVPGCYFFIGSANPDKGLDYPHHHPRFDVDETALPAATALMTAVVIDLLKA